MRRLAVALAALWPAAVLAHSPVQGLDAFYNGILHPLFVPAQVLLALCTGLLVGQQGAVRHWTVAVAYLSGLVSGLFAAEAVAADPVRLERAILLLTLATGLLVVWARNLPFALLAALALVAGTLLGLDSLQDNLPAGGRRAGLFGSGIALYLLMLYAMRLAEAMDCCHWARVGVRVIASWLTASTLLVLALAAAPAS